MPRKPWYKKKRFLIPGAIVGLWMASLTAADVPPESLPAAAVLAPAPSNSRPFKTAPAPTSTSVISPSPKPVAPKSSLTPAPVKAPVAKVKPSNCDSNYSGACVPVASDVDCAGGSGNGPAFVSGPIYVVGFDVYDLDRDDDGVACER